MQSAPMSEWEGGSRYDPASVYYHQMRGVVTGTDPGDSVEVWFEGGGEVSDSFTYQAVSESGNRVLVVAAEDYTGASPVQDPAARTTSTRTPTRWPPTARRRTSTTSTPPAGWPRRARRAEPLRRGRLGDRKRPGHPHRRPRWRQRRPAGTRRTAGVPLVHERGRQGAPRRRLRRSAVHHGAAVRPQGRDRLQPAPPGTDPRRCLPLFGSFFGGDATNDVLQYWLGGYVAVANDGHVEAPRSTRSASTTRSRASWGLDDPVFAGNTLRGRRSSRRAASCRPTSSSSSTAGPRRGTTSRAARSTRTPEPSTSTRRSPTSPTRGSPARSPYRQLAGR